MSQDDNIPLELILIGKTGVGKSDSGNSILQRNILRTSSGDQSETFNVRCEWAEHSGYRIKVTDAPGIFDTEKGEEETDKEAAVRNLSKAIIMCPSGVHAFLLVISPFEKNTSESVQTIKILKAIFSDDVVKNHCVIVITHGDGLDMALEKSKLTFKEWCKQQGGERGKLFKECNYRCVLFYNQGSHYESKRQQSVQNLLSLVKQMTATTGLYTHAKFKKVAAVREEMIIEEKAAQTSELIQMKMSLLMSDVEKCSGDPSENHFRQLLQRTHQISDDIDEMVAKSKVYKTLQPQIRSIKKSVDNLEQVVKNKKEGLLKEDEYRKKFQEEIDTIRKKTTAMRDPENSNRYFKKCAKIIFTIAGAALKGSNAGGIVETVVRRFVPLEVSTGSLAVIGAVVGAVAEAARSFFGTSTTGASQT